MKPKPLTCIDIFAGCGGFSTGILQSGIEVVAALDSEPIACATYYANLCDENTKIVGNIPRNDRKYFGKPNGYRYLPNGGVRFPPVRAIFIKDIFDVSGWDLMDAAEVESVDLVIGSPPCQSFSQCNTKKKKGDLRDFLVFELGRLILEIDPDSFTLENVPPFMKAKLPDGRNLPKTFMEMVNKRDWDMYYEIQEMYPSGAWERHNETKATGLHDF